MPDTIPVHPTFSFVARQLRLLGDRDPLEVLEATPERLAEIVGTHSPEVLRRRPAEGVWSPNEILGHLGDTEWVFGFRARTILLDEEPTLMGVEQELWVERQKHQERPPEQHLETFRALRQVNLGFWRGLSAADLERSGRHAQAGVEMSLGFLRRLLAGHDLSHLEQLAERLP